MDRLRQRADFLAVANGARVQAPAFTLQGRRREDLGPVRIGFTVTKKQGNSVERNRIRRRLKEAVRLSAQFAMQPGHDYVIVAHREVLGALDDLFPRLADEGREGSRHQAQWEDQIDRSQ